jgi:hypothetical protein
MTVKSKSDSAGVSQAERIQRKLFGQKSLVKRSGTFREKELHGLIERQNYCYGMLRAADSAKFFGKSAVTVLTEIQVAK